MRVCQNPALSPAVLDKETPEGGPVGKTATPWALASCASAVLLTGLVVPTLDDPTSSPDVVQRRFSEERQMSPALATAPVNLAGFSDAHHGFASDEFAPAPGYESALNGREATAPRRPVIVAVGNNAKSMCDPAFKSGFTKLASDLDVSFADCKDRDAVELRLVNRVDMALLGGSLSPRERRAGLRQTRIALELFALAVAADFPLQSVSSSQMRQLLTGTVHDWQQLGCNRGAVVVVIPSHGPLASRAARKMILGDNFTANAVRSSSDRHVADQILRNPGAIAVVRVKTTPTMGMKLLQIDWTPPTPEAFGYGTYPYGMPLQVVTSGKPDAVVQRFLEYAASQDGRELLGRSLLLPR